MDQEADPELATIALKPPRLTSAPILLAIALSAMGFLVGYVSMPGRFHWRVAAIGALACAATMAVVVLAQSRLFRQRESLQGITVTQKTLALPASPRSRRIARIPVEQVRSAVMLGRGWSARLVIDTGRRLFAFPASQLGTPDAATRLQAALKTAFQVRPDGASLSAAMEGRHRLAGELGRVRPAGTWCAAATIVAVFCLQLGALRPGDPFGLIDLGANASMLVWHGQWFRLITASLLHGTPRHLFGNLLSLLVIGGMVERLVGFRHMLVLLLASCIVAQLVSAFASIWSSSHVYSVGLSGGIFGLLGALAAIGWRFGDRLPAGYRFPRRTWLSIAAVYAVAFPLLVPQIDSWAHAGGALAGFVAGALLCGVRADLTALRSAGWLTNDALAACLLVFAVGIGAEAVHAARAGSYLSDRLVLAEGIARRPFSPQIRNALAWQIVTDRKSPPVLLRWSEYLAWQAVGQLQKTRPKAWDTAAAADTEAAAAYRLGDRTRAARIEAELPWQTQPFGSHLALFLEGALQDGGTQIVGDSGPASPVITLSAGVLHLSQAAPAPNGARVYAVLHRPGGLAGVLFFRLPRGFSGTQILPLPTSKAAPSTSAPPPLWLDGATTIQVALFDRRGCYCDWPAMGPNFAAYVPDQALKP